MVRTNLLVQPVQLSFHQLSWTCFIAIAEVEVFHEVMHIIIIGGDDVVLLELLSQKARVQPRIDVVRGQRLAHVDSVQLKQYVGFALELVGLVFHRSVIGTELECRYCRVIGFGGLSKIPLEKRCLYPCFTLLQMEPDLHECKQR